MLWAALCLSAAEESNRPRLWDTQELNLNPSKKRLLLLELPQGFYL